MFVVKLAIRKQTNSYLSFEIGIIGSKSFFFFLWNLNLYIGTKQLLFCLKLSLYIGTKQLLFCLETKVIYWNQTNSIFVSKLELLEAKNSINVSKLELMEANNSYF